MRVAFVAEVTAQHEELGRTRRLRRIAELLANRGHEATVFCAQWWDGDHDTFQQEDVTYHAVTTEPPGDTPSRRFALSLPGALRRVKPDVIHATAVPKHVLAAKTASKLARAACRRLVRVAARNRRERLEIAPDGRAFAGWGHHALGDGEDSSSGTRRGRGGRARDSQQHRYGRDSGGPYRRGC